MNPTTRAYLRARRDYDQAPSVALAERALDYADALDAYRAAGWPDVEPEPETGALFRAWQREAEDAWSAKEAALVAALDAARAELDILAQRLGELEGERRAIVTALGAWPDSDLLGLAESRARAADRAGDLHDEVLDLRRALASRTLGARLRRWLGGGR
jgi:hypothetical protein